MNREKCFFKVLHHPKNMADFFGINLFTFYPVRKISNMEIIFFDGKIQRFSYSIEKIFKYLENLPKT